MVWVGIVERPQQCDQLFYGDPAAGGFECGQNARHSACIGRAYRCVNEAALQTGHLNGLPCGRSPRDYTQTICMLSTYYRDLFPSIPINQFCLALIVLECPINGLLRER